MQITLDYDITIVTEGRLEACWYYADVKRPKYLAYCTSLLKSDIVKFNLIDQI